MAVREAILLLFEVNDLYLSIENGDGNRDENKDEENDHDDPDSFALFIQPSDLVKGFSIRSAHEQCQHSPEPPYIPEESQKRQRHNDEGKYAFGVLCPKQCLEATGCSITSWPPRGMGLPVKKYLNQ